MKRSLCAVAACAILTMAASAARIDFDVKADRPDQLYVPGEEAMLVVACRYADGTTPKDGFVDVRLDDTGDNIVSTRRVDLAKTPTFVVRGTLNEPGFLRMQLSVVGPRDDGYRLWSVGFAPHKIRRTAEEPKDFDAFWQQAREKLAREVPLDPQVTRNDARSTGAFDFYNVSFATFGRRIYGFMSVPKDAAPAKKYPVKFTVSAAGFGSWAQDMDGSPDEIRVFLSTFDWVPGGRDWPKNKAKYDALNAAATEKWGGDGYRTAGIAAGRESCFFYPFILGCDRVIDWIAARPEADANRLRYEGTSQGGMMGFILAGLNKHILRCCLFVPAGCEQSAWKKGRLCGWPRFVMTVPEKDRAAVEKWAPYFDAANFAARVTCPLRVYYGFSDPTCWASSVWTAFNACPSQDKSIRGGIGMTHNCFNEFYAEGRDWLHRNDACELAPATPESQGVSSAAILRWIEVCEKSLDALHGFVLVRHGKTVAEGWWAPQSADRLHPLFSHSKGFTSSAVGLLVDDGKLDLDECVADILPDKMPADASPRLKAIRVRDLFTMNLGCDNDHYLNGKTNDWAKTALAKTLVRDGGRGFRYDSDATHLLACIVERRTGMKLMDFLRTRLLDPLGISPNAWTSVSPTGVACGGWGMNMTTRDLVRFAQLYLQEGRWGDRRILSREWVDLASACHTRSGWCGKTDFGDDDWHRGYGFQFWRCRHDAYRADGAYGQYSIIMPEQDAVLSITASLGPMQDEIDTVWNVLLPAFSEKPLPEDPAALEKLRTKLASLSLKTVRGAKDDPLAPSVLGKTWKLDGTNGGFHLKDVRLTATGDGWELAATGDFGTQTIPLGYRTWSAGKAKFSGETFKIFGEIPGEQETASSGAWVKPGVFQAKTHFLSTVFAGDWTLDFTTPGEVKFAYAAGACKAEATGK